MNHRFAQTNLQLLNQMCRDGYPGGDLNLIARSYDLSTRLLTGRYRGSGKTFIAHLVGTASILAALRVRATIVAAGLIHAVYESGDFGDGIEGISNAKRELVRTAVGGEVEDCVAKYTSLRWSLQVMVKIHDEVDGLDPESRDVLLIRLANELEDYLDLGILYCGDQKRRTADYGDDRGQVMINIANKLGFVELGRAMACVFEEVTKAKVAPAFPKPQRNFSYLIAPLSYQRRWPVYWKRWARRKSDQFSRLLKVTSHN